MWPCFIWSNFVQFSCIKRIRNSDDKFDHFNSWHLIKHHQVFEIAFLEIITVPVVKNSINVRTCLQNINISAHRCHYDPFHNSETIFKSHISPYTIFLKISILLQSGFYKNEGRPFIPFFIDILLKFFVMLSVLMLFGTIINSWWSYFYWGIWYFLLIEILVFDYWCLGLFVDFILQTA